MRVAPSLRVAYLLSIAPQPQSSFTMDEVVVLEGRVNLLRAGVVAAGQDHRWMTSGSNVSLRALWALARSGISQPRRLYGALSDLVGPAIGAPQDVAIAIRATAGAAYLARHLDVDIIHAQFAGPAAAAAFAWHRLTGKPFTVRAHAYDIFVPYRWAPRVLAESAAVVVISQDGQAALAREMDIPSTLIRVGIPVGDVRQRPSLPPRSPFRLVSVGSLVPKKGHDAAIDAIHRLTRAGVEVQLDLYGAGPAEAVLARSAAEGPGRVIIHGAVPVRKMRSLYADYDALLMASTVADDGDRDGIPVVIMEAMAANLPVLATKVGGIGELVLPGVTGTITDGHPEALAETIARAVHQYGDLLAMTRAARMFVANEFDVQRNTAALVELWLGLMDPRE